ncbi:MAG: zinc ribbon domain-containing protein [Lachnospiraceae bacterium]|nr:zinc ribbon domain-containing protein [Lachnospiraceae bacterium]
MAVCIKCGAQIADGSAFCSNCGTRQNMQQQYQQAPQMQPQWMQSPPTQDALQEMYQQQSMQGAPREASGGRYTPTGYISGGYGMNSGGNDGKKSGKGLVIALIAGIVVLIAVIAVLGFMLLRGKPGGGEGNTGNTKVTREASTEATTKNTTGTTSDDGATDQSVAKVSKEDIAAMAGYYESREMPWVIFINADGSYQSRTLRTNLEESGTWEAVYADRGDGEMVKMVYLYPEDKDADDNEPLIWIEEEHGFIIGPWEGENGTYQHLDSKPYPKTTDGGFEAETAESLYRPVLQETYEIVRNGYDENADYSYLSSGLMERLMYPGDRNLMESIGYLMEDISGDGIPELLIGETVDYEYDDKGERSFLFKAYTCRDGELVQIFEGWGRSSYQWTGDNGFYYYGSGGASNSLFGRAHLRKDGTELIWDEVYLTEEVFPDGLGIFYNTTGSWDAADSEKLDISQNEFWEIMNDMEDACVIVPFTPIGEFEP